MLLENHSNVPNQGVHTMPTADELRAGIDGARAALRVAIQTSGDAWETPKGTADDGEAGWSPRQTAEHVIPAEMMFATGVCAACGYDGPDNPLTSTEFATPDDALAALDAVAEAANSKIKYVQDEELGKSQGGEGMAAVPVAGLMAMNTWHLADHAAQISRPAF
ncbi:MAG: DinB family protein [Chloroflexi bacterium]|nr:DinB family protein [Chloroflexota bacterium]MYC01575.1 DinB family protein [Chloroflexota bacterium]